MDDIINAFANGKTILRCINSRNTLNISEGKEYEVIDLLPFSFNVLLKDDTGNEWWYQMGRFELVK